MACYKNLFLPTGGKESSGDRIRCRFFLVMTGGLDPPCWPCSCYGHDFFSCCSCVERRLCCSAAGAAVLSSSWDLCLWLPPKPSSVKMSLQKKFITWLRLPERHFRVYKSWFAHAVCEQTGTHWDGWCWEAVGGLRLQWILLGEDPCLGPMAAPGSDAAHGLPSAKDKGYKWRAISSMYFNLFHENKVR